MYFQSCSWAGRKIVLHIIERYIRDMFNNDGISWKVEQYLKTLHESDPSSDSEWPWMGRMEQQQQLYGKWEQWVQIECALHVDFMKHKMKTFE